MIKSYMFPVFNPLTKEWFVQIGEDLFETISDEEYKKRQKKDDINTRK
jgi:hypothetical protein